MLYDCIVVGGGPAGAICSMLLQKQGIHCLLLEKRTSIDEKICGGFLPDRCRNRILACGIELSELVSHGNRIDGYYEMRDEQTKSFFYKKDQYGMGIYRKTLDSFLIDQSRMAGTTVVYGENVCDYQKKAGIYQVNGYQGKYMIWATGAKPPLSIKAFDHHAVQEKMDGQSLGISEIVQIDRCCFNSHAVYFWYTKGLNDYFWAIPLSENTWNIGYWTQKDHKHLKQHFLAGRKKYIESGCGEIRTLRSPKGALLGNIDFSDCLIEKNMFCCGDLAGMNNILTGEGIAQAVQSAQKTANQMIQLIKQEKAYEDTDI